MWKLGFVAKTCLYSSNQGRPTVYPLGISTGTLVVSRQLLPECKHEYMLKCAGATTFVRCCYIYCKWRLFQQTNITANVSHLAMTRFTRFGQMFFRTFLCACCTLTWIHLHWRHVTVSHRVQVEFYVNENTFKERLKLFFIKNQRSSKYSWQGASRHSPMRKCWQACWR